MSQDIGKQMEIAALSAETVFTRFLSDPKRLGPNAMEFGEQDKAELRARLKSWAMDRATRRA